MVHHNSSFSTLGTIAIATAVFLANLTAASAAKFALKDIKGKFAFQFHGESHSTGSVANAEAQTVNRVGVLDADGKGAIAGRSISVLDDGGNVVVIDYDWTGTYTVRDDGTGTLTINAPGGGQIRSCHDGEGSTVGNCETALTEESYAFVIIKGKDVTTFTLIRTDAPVGRRLFLRGVATNQEFKKGGGGFSIF